MSKISWPTKPVHVRVSSKRVDYVFEINSKWTILRGDTSTGKTTLVQLLKGAHAKIESGELVFRPLPRLDSLDWEDWERAILRVDENTVFYEDEDDLGNISLKMQGVFVKSSAAFLLVCRDTLPGIPHAVSDLCEVVVTRKDGKITNTLVPVKFNAATDTTIYGMYKTLCTEDSKSGFIFFYSYLHRVVSAFGKDKIPDLIEHSVRTLYLVDACGFGPTYYRSMGALDHSGTNGIKFIESFEALVLRSDFLQITEDPPLNCANKEKWFEERLRSELVLYGQVYSKSNPGKCLLLDCCFHSDHCLAFNRASKFRQIVGDLYRSLEQFGIRSSDERRDFEHAVKKGLDIEDCIVLLDKSSLEKSSPLTGDSGEDATGETHLFV